MQNSLKFHLGLGALLALSACAAAPPLAPAPAQNIDAARFYTGRWYEIARTPMYITNGCVAGTTDYSTDAGGHIQQFDACHMNTPAGEQKSIAGPVTITNPGANNEIVTHYHVFYGLIPINRTYWIEDHGTDYGWFIFADPALTRINIYTRTPRPSAAEVQALTAKVRALGYDTAKLEYPAEFPPGGG